MRLAAFALAAVATLGFASSASAQYHHRSYAPAPSVNFGVATPGGFSFGYSNFGQSFYRPGWDYAYRRGHYHYVPGYYVPHGRHYHYVPGHYEYHRR